jgi:hypothetical protein
MVYEKYVRDMVAHCHPAGAFLSVIMMLSVIFFGKRESSHGSVVG